MQDTVPTEPGRGPRLHQRFDPSRSPLSSSHSKRCVSLDPLFISPAAQPAFTSLVLSAWLYHFCQVGASVMIIATSLAALGSGLLPRWLALAGLVVALLTLLHFVVPLIGALAGLLWIAAVSALMLVGTGSASGPRRLAR